MKNTNTKEAYNRYLNLIECTTKDVSSKNQSNGITTIKYWADNKKYNMTDTTCLLLNEDGKHLRRGRFNTNTGEPIDFTRYYNNSCNEWQ